MYQNHSLKIDTEYKYLKPQQINMKFIVSPRPRKVFAPKWAIILQQITGQSLLMRMRTYRYRFYIVGLMSLSYHVPEVSNSAWTTLLYMSAIPVKQKQVNNRIYLRFFVQQFYFAITMERTPIHGQILNQFLRIKRYGKFPKNLKKRKKA
jgi:hypothetical protein